MSPHCASNYRSFFMLDSNPLLKHLRSKPPRTRTAIAIIAALIPTLAVSYAQFYMRARDLGLTANVANAQPAEEQNVSIFEALGKIFDEGKKTVSSSVESLKSIDTSALDSALISASSSGEGTASAQSDIGAVPGVNWANATVTKTIEN